MRRRVNQRCISLRFQIIVVARRASSFAEGETVVGIFAKDACMLELETPLRRFSPGHMHVFRLLRPPASRMLGLLRSSSRCLQQARPSKPLKDWGTHNRDRLVRSLQLYGFGRWPRIRKEAGASIRSLEVGDLMPLGLLDTVCPAACRAGMDVVTE